MRSGDQPQTAAVTAFILICQGVQTKGQWTKGQSLE